MTTELFTLPGGGLLAGVRVPAAPTPEPGHQIVRYSIERNGGYGVEYGTGLAEVFCSFLDRGPAHHEFYAEAVPLDREPDDDTPGRRCQWSPDHGWGKWYKG